MATLYDGHASKRQRTDVEGHGIQHGNRDSFDDPHKPQPSAVIHVRGLAETATDEDLIEALQVFGAVSYVMTMPKKRQALIEFEDIEGARSLVSYASTAPIYVCGTPAFFNYSTSQKIQRQPGGLVQGGMENHILLITVVNARYPITVDVMHTICSPHGNVRRIVIFKKSGVQVMVEFDSVTSAASAKEALNGADIYSGCCTLKIEYAKPTKLNVYRNDTESWDYENPAPALKESPRPQPLLADPRYSARPVPYTGEQPEMPPPRNGPGPPVYGATTGYQQAMDYELPASAVPLQRGNGKYDQFGRPIKNPPPPRYGGGYGPSAGYEDPYGAPGGVTDPYGSMYPPSGGPPSYEDQSMTPTAGMGQEGAVLMVYGLHPQKVNCKALFNLFCLYGNVVRVKFLYSKEGSAMIQLGDRASCDRAVEYLHNVLIFDKRILLARSKQAFLQDVPTPHTLPDGSLSFLDFMGSRNNRFSNPEAAAKNRIQPPNRVLHYFNAPLNITEEDINKVMEDAGVPLPTKIKQFAPKGDKVRSSTGLIEWDEQKHALEALMMANHVELPNPNGRNPYVFKLCFSSTPIKD